MMAMYGESSSSVRRRAHRVIGRVEVLLNGELLLNKSGAVARGIGEESGKCAVRREAAKDCFGTAGFTEEIIPAGLDVTLTATEDFNPHALTQIKGNGTLIFRRATTTESPKQFTLERVTCMSPVDITAGEGEITVSFEACEGNGWIIN